MPDTIVASPETTQTTTDPQITHGTQQDADRRALYEKHYGTATPSPAEQAASTEGTAQVTTTAEPVAQPVTATPDATATLMETLRAMQAEIAALRTEVKPAAPVEPVASAEPDPDWIALLREGKIAEATAALENSVAKKVIPDAVAQAQAQTREVMRAEAEIESFVRELRTQNPDLAPLEKLIAVEANEKLSALREAGKLVTTEDTVREYKKAVLEAKENARKLYQTLRGSGVEQARVRTQEVLSSSTLAPNAVDQQRTQQGTSSDPVPETTEDYFAKRRALEAKARGLG